MIDIRAKLQLALDTSLFEKGIYSYWNRKTETQGEDPNEYIIYTYGGEDTDDYAEDTELVKMLEATVRYYYKDTLLNNSKGRKRVKDNEKLIIETLINAGFELPYGSMDLGDIDSKISGDLKGSGFNTIVFECEYWLVV